MLQARLSRGITMQQARADIDVIAHRLATVYPEQLSEEIYRPDLSWVDTWSDHFRTTLYTLAAAVGLLLLIACANVANMLLAQGDGAGERDGGARRRWAPAGGRLIRQLLMESLLLALGGAVVGCLFAYVGIKAWWRRFPDAIPQRGRHPPERARAAVQPGDGRCDRAAVRARAGAADWHGAISWSRSRIRAKASAADSGTANCAARWW